MNDKTNMKKFMPYFLFSYDKKIILLIMDKYNCDEMNAFQDFVSSKTYKLLSDINCGLWEYGFYNIMDMYVSEKETGSPLNAEFLKTEG